MFNLQKKIKEQKANKQAGVVNGTGRISVRDRLLTQEIQDVTSHIPDSCNLVFPDHNKIHEFVLNISPQSGYWSGGAFSFHISVPLEYNIMPPKVLCTTKIYHPNIDEHGKVCLSILRSTALDGTGWAPTRTIKDVIWGLLALFMDLLNFDDPLNVEAAEHYLRNKESFIRKVKDYVYRYAR